MAERVQSELSTCPSHAGYFTRLPADNSVNAVDDADASPSEISPNRVTDLSQIDESTQTASESQEHARERSDECVVVLLNPGDAKRKGAGPITSVEERNHIAHSNPDLVMNVITGVLTARASQEGSCKNTDGLACWGPAFIPFHLSFIISCGGAYCHHLVSGKNRKTKKAVSHDTDVL